MTDKLSAARSRGKNRRCQIRNQSPQIRNQISPVMLTVLGLLPKHKSAHHLAILLDEPLSSCQKLLCGARQENPRVIAKLLQSDFGRPVLFALMGDAKPAWFSRYKKQLDVNLARRELRENMARIDALQEECEE